jgi:hypothetical protein
MSTHSCAHRCRVHLAQSSCMHSEKRARRETDERPSGVALTRLLQDQWQPLSCPETIAPYSPVVKCTQTQSPGHRGHRTCTPHTHTLNSEPQWAPSQVTPRVHHRECVGYHTNQRRCGPLTRSRRALTLRRATEASGGRPRSLLPRAHHPRTLSRARRTPAGPPFR